MAFLSVFTTLPSHEAAMSLARHLVAQRLAACAQVEAITSVYVWEDSLQEEPEFRLVLKTREERYADLEAEIHARHPYALPAIHACRWEQVHHAFAGWITTQTGG